MNHGDSDAPHSIAPVWVDERRKLKGKEAKVGRMGTIAQCQPGDVVACESLDRKRVIYLEIAWNWNDGKASQVRLWDFRNGGISCSSEFLRCVQSVQRVRWLKVRPK